MVYVRDKRDIVALDQQDKIPIIHKYQLSVINFETNQKYNLNV